MRAICLSAIAMACSAPTAAGHARGSEVPAMSAPAPSAEAQAYARQDAALLASARKNLAALEARTGPATVAGVLEPLNELMIALDAAQSRAGLTRSVHPDPDMRAAATRSEADFSALATDIGLSQPLYHAVAALDVRGEPADTQRLVAHLLRDFRRDGVDRDDATRDRIRALRETLVRVGQTFDRNIREDVRRVQLAPAALAGLPADYVAAHPPGADGTVTLTTDYPDYLPFMSYAEDDAARLALYRAFRQRGAPANGPVLAELLARRHELAQLLGAPDWATYATGDKMIRSPQAAQAFIDRVDAAARGRASADLDELLAALRRRDPHATAVGDWQKTFLEEQVKRERYHYDAQAARAFFPFARVRQGLFDVTARMFGVSYRPVDVPVWHPDVTAYELLERGEVIGRFYLDLHPRADKYKHAAAFPIQAGLAGRQLPEAALVCNFPAGDDALLEHDDVQTFFHEFGHLLHHLFAGKQRWVAFSGIATEWDFVEAPSQMLEEWTFDAATLKTFAINAAGQTLDDGLIAAMRRARDFGRGVWTRQQMFYAAASLQLHRGAPDAGEIATTMNALQTKYAPFAPVPGTHFELSFGHLEGYSALYYTYMWSLVIAKDMFSAFPAHDLLDPAVARRYRERVLSPGGSRDAAALVHDFLGRDYAFDAFGAWLDGA